MRTCEVRKVMFMGFCSPWTVDMMSQQYAGQQMPSSMAHTTSPPYFGLFCSITFRISPSVTVDAMWGGSIEVE